MYIVQTVHTGLMLDVHCADCTYRTNVNVVQTVHCADCADCTYRINVRCNIVQTD